MKPSVVVVGSFVQDLTFRCATFPQPGETKLGTFITGPGGKGSNQAVAAARAGAKTRFIGAVGHDAFAEGARAFHRSEGIDSHLISKPRHATATAGIIVNAAGQNEIVVAIGASAHLRTTDVPPSLIEGATVVVAQHEASLATNAQIFRAARKQNTTTVLNPAPMRADFALSVLRHVDVLIPNESEFVELVRLIPACTTLIRRSPYHAEGEFNAESLLGLELDHLQPLCRAFGVPVLIVTLGARGCFVSLADRGRHIPAYPVKVVDSTGAGDAFVGGFAAGLVRFKGDVLHAARYGNAIAALSVTKFGTAPSMPRKAAIERLLRSDRSNRSR
ncbi:MAG: ribokinase [Opitutus sp.]